MKIRSIKALEILDSRGRPTIQTTVYLEDGSIGVAAIPSGASTGSHEVLELRDHDERYHGLGVRKAIANVEKIAEKIIGLEASEQKNIDDLMIALDGTENKSNLGANAILSVSLAVACAQAKSEKKSLFSYLTKFNPEHAGKYIMPIPQMNIMNGGKHANWSSDIQEYMILPIKADSINEAIRMGAEVYFSLKQVLEKKGYSTTVGDEGGFAPKVKTNDEPFELISEAIQQAGYTAGVDFVFGIDAAASEFYQNGKYVLKTEKQKLKSPELAEFYEKIIAKYPLENIEDPFAEDDWAGFVDFTAKHTDKQIVGDDLYVTNLARLERGLTEKATNSILIKLNQIGTLSETIVVILKAKENGLTTIVSHRSGETTDTFLIDLAIAMQAGQIKIGAPCRGERVAKYNRLLQIADKIEGNNVYAQWPWLKK